jgi:hypothetical protein
MKIRPIIVSIYNSPYHKHDMSRLLCFLQLGGDWCYRNQRAVKVSYIVGEDQHRPGSTLFTPFEWIQICQVNITAMVDPVFHCAGLTIELLISGLISHLNIPPQNFTGSAAFLLAPL